MASGAEQCEERDTANGGKFSMASVHLRGTGSMALEAGQYADTATNGSWEIGSTLLKKCSDSGDADMLGTTFPLSPNSETNREMLRSKRASDAKSKHTLESKILPNQPPGSCPVPTLKGINGLQSCFA
jgi:hypothetical protein